MRLTFAQALARALNDALAADPNVVLLGSGFAGLNVEERQMLTPIMEKYASRVMPTSISELGVAGACVGAALGGLRPVVDLTTGSFIFQAFPQVVNEAANIHYMSGGQARVPATFYCIGGVRGAGAAQHSHRTQAMLGNVPGLQLLLPGTASDAYHLLKWALLESQNPSVYFNHSLLFDEAEDFDPAAPMLPVGQARVLRAGSDVTLVTSSVIVPRALAAADTLAREHGIAAEVIDLRTLAPLDRDTVIRSVRKTGRVVIADECSRSFGTAAEIGLSIVEAAFDALKAPVRRVTTADVPIPFSPVLEEEVIVTPAKIVTAVLQTVRPR